MSTRSQDRRPRHDFQLRDSRLGGGSAAKTCTMTVTSDPEVVCSNFSDGAPAGTYAAVAEFFEYDAANKTLIVFIGCSGITSLSDAETNGVNAAFLTNETVTSGVNGTAYGRFAIASAWDTSAFAEDGADFISSYEGTYMAYVIEF